MPVAKSKKEIKKAKVDEITALLKAALPKLKNEIGEKKFERKIKKAAKVLADSVKPQKNKPKPTVKKAAKKIVKRRTAK